MKLELDHIGIAIADLEPVLAFFRDVLGLEITGSEEVAGQHVRVHFLPVAPASPPKIELVEPLGDSPITAFTAKRGNALHHVAFRVADVAAAVAALTARGVRMIDAVPRPGAEGALIAFVHPSSTGGILVELRQTSH